MNRVSTAERLREIMTERNLRQVDILNLVLPICAKYDVKMNKSDISQYVSGKAEPSKEKLVVLGMALNVAESWLIGFDVPPERNDTQIQAEKDFDISYRYSMLTELDKKIVHSFIELDPGIRSAIYDMLKNAISSDHSACDSVSDDLQN